MELSAAAKKLRENFYISALTCRIAWPIQKACAALASEIKRKVRKNSVAIRLPDGQSMRIDRDSGIWLSSLLYWEGVDGYEQETSRTLRFFFSRAQTFVDVGANYGLYAILAALWNPKLSVVAFEPVPSIFAGLRRNVMVNGLEARIRCQNVALSSQTQKTVLYLPGSEGRDREATGTLAANSWQVRKHAPGIEIQAVTFDDYESAHPMKVDLIKIDVEDFEAEVLRGMQRVILRDRPFIICEVLPRTKEHKNLATLDIIKSLNYFPYWITPCGYIRISGFDFERAFTDFLLSPVEISGEVVTDLNSFYKEATVV